MEWIPFDILCLGVSLSWVGGLLHHDETMGWVLLAGNTVEGNK